MKRIAITQRLIENRDYYEVRDALDIRWTQLCKSLDYLPVLLPTYYDFKHYFEMFKIDGIILSSGNDLGSLSNNELSRKRDSFEKELIKFAIRSKIPILGICRGMQIIADFFQSEFEKVDRHIGTKHKLIVSHESKYIKDLGKLLFVNSYHNYVIKNVSEDFIVPARSEDGAIEAIEHKKYKIFGQMWHPERENPFREVDLKIIQKLFE